MKRIHSLEEVLTLSFTKCYSFDLYSTFSYSSSSFYIHEQLLPFFLLGVRAVSLGRADLCKVFYPFVPALKRLLSMTAFFCGNRIPLPKQQVLPTNYHYGALGDPGLKISTYILKPKRPSSLILM